MCGCYAFEITPVTLDTKEFERLLKRLKITKKSEKNTKKCKVYINVKTTGYVVICFRIRP